MLKKSFDNVKIEKEMKSESGFSLAIASQPFVCKASLPGAIYPSPGHLIPSKFSWRGELEPCLMVIESI